MNAEAFLAQQRYFDLVHGVTLRTIALLADEDLEFRPKEEMRSVKDILFHMYAVEQKLAESVKSGKLSENDTKEYEPEDAVGAAAAAKIATVLDMKRYAKTCHDAAKTALAGVSDKELSSNVASPYGEFTGAQFITFIHDEHWHHRGQLFTYLRLLGKKPPGLYDYEASTT